MTSIYVMESTSGLVKIGVSKSPIKRAQNLENASGFAIKIKHTRELENAKAVEKAAHTILKSKRKNGEWFNVTAREARKAIDDAIDLLSDSKKVSGNGYSLLWQFKITPEQRDKITRMANTEGVTTSEVVRRIIDSY